MQNVNKSYLIFQQKNFENEKNKKIKEWGSHRFCAVKWGWGGSVEEERESDKERSESKYKATKSTETKKRSKAKE